MLQVGQSWLNRRRAPSADLLSTPHDLSPEISTDDHHVPRGPYQVESPFEDAPAPKAPLVSWRPSRLRLLVGALALGLALGAVEEAARVAGYSPDMQRLARVAGFGIDQVTLKGPSFSFDREIFDALDLANVKTCCSRYRRRQGAHRALAVDRYGRADARLSGTSRHPRYRALALRALDARRPPLSDRQDRARLGRRQRRYALKLPHFLGEGAATEAAPFMAQLARYPELSSNFATAERVSDRRWRLKLSNETTIELPADGEVAALETIAGDGA